MLLYVCHEFETKGKEILENHIYLTKICHYYMTLMFSNGFTQPCEIVDRQKFNVKLFQVIFVVQINFAKISTVTCLYAF